MTRRLYLLLIVLVLIALFLAPATTHASTYSDAILADSPYTYYRFGESGGTTATDTSGNSHDGTYTGTVTLGASGAILSDSDTAITLDGSTGYVSVPTTATFTNHDFAVEAWIKPASVEHSETILDAYSGGDPGEEMTIYIYPGGNFIWSFNGTQVATAGIEYGTWSYIVCNYSYSSGLAYLYVNGVFKMYGSAGPFVGTNPVIDIGATLGAYSMFQGDLEEVAIYDHALSLEDIVGHYEAAGYSLNPPTPTPTATATETLTPTPAPWILATLPNGQTYLVNYDIRMGDILLAVIGLIIIGLFFFNMIIAFLRR